MSNAILPNLHLGMLGRLPCMYVMGLLGELSFAQGASGLDLCWIYKVTGIGVPLEHLKIVAFVCPSARRG